MYIVINVDFSCWGYKFFVLIIVLVRGNEDFY